MTSTTVIVIDHKYFDKPPSTSSYSENRRVAALAFPRMIRCFLFVCNIIWYVHTPPECCTITLHFQAFPSVALLIQFPVMPARSCLAYEIMYIWTEKYPEVWEAWIARIFSSNNKLWMDFRLLTLPGDYLKEYMVCLLLSTKQRLCIWCYILYWWGKKEHSFHITSTGYINPVLTAQSS
jgi:hypothetical protein